jgi:hypothetical protein
MRDIVGPPSITAFFVTAGERGRQLAQATLREAEEAYFFGNDEVEEAETQDRHPGRRSEDGDGDQEQPQEEHEADMLALPSPDQLQSISE